MTEVEWLAANRVQKLLRYVHSKDEPSDRKLRLFGVACCRRAAEHIPDVALSAVIDQCERLADDFALARLTRAGRTADQVLESIPMFEPDWEEDYYAFARAVAQLTEWPITPEYCADSCMHALCGHDDYDTGQGEMLFQVDLLHDIFGNPFRPVTFAPAWRTDTALSLARGMYESRDFSAMPILADAFQDAGCDRAEVLDHCRGPGPHVRGCWVMDLVLGEE